MATYICTISDLTNELSLGSSTDAPMYSWLDLLELPSIKPIVKPTARTMARRPVVERMIFITARMVVIHCWHVIASVHAQATPLSNEFRE